MEQPTGEPSTAAGDGKIVIAGTGRAGTTLLVQVLTDLGFDTGYKKGIRVNPDARAGLERNILGPSTPRVVKSPRLSTELGPLLEAGLVRVEHVLVPVRDLDVAAASRVRASGYGRSLNAAGGLLWGTKRASQQRAAVAEMLAQLIVTLARFDVPHTLLAFPRFATDAEYTHGKLRVLEASLALDDVCRVLAERYRPDFVHETPLDETETRRTRRNAPLSAATRVVAGLRARLGSRSRPRP